MVHVPRKKLLSDQVPPVSHMDANERVRAPRTLVWWLDRRTDFKFEVHSTTLESVKTLAGRDLRWDGRDRLENTI